MRTCWGIFLACVLVWDFQRAYLFEIFGVNTDVDACDCTWGRKEHFKRDNPLIRDSCTFHSAQVLTGNGEIYHSGVNVQYRH